MNTLFSVVVLASVLARVSGDPSDTCTEAVIAVNGDTAGAIQASLKGAVAADLTGATIKGVLRPATGGGDAITLTDATADLPTASFATTAVDVKFSDVLPDGATAYNVEISYMSGTDEIKCPLMCGATKAAPADAAAACNTPADACTEAPVTVGANGIATAALKGSLITGAIVTATLTYTPTDGGAAIGPDEVEVDLTAAFDSTAVNVVGTSSLEEGKDYTVGLTFPGVNWPSASTVTCTDVTGVMCSSDCEPAEEDASAAMSASVALLIAAFVARAF